MSEDLSRISRDALLALASQAPGVSALLDYFERRKAEQDSESIRRTFESLARELERLRERLVASIERGSELERQLSEISTQVAIIARRSHNPMRLDAAAKLMANALLRADDGELIEHAERQLFLNALESLSDAAIAFIASSVSSTSGETSGGYGTNGFATLSTLDPPKPGMDPHLRMGLIGECSRFNLLVVRMGRGLSNSSSDPYSSYEVIVTPLAVRFVRFVTDG